MLMLSAPPVFGPGKFIPEIRNRGGTDLPGDCQSVFIVQAIAHG